MENQALVTIARDEDAILITINTPRIRNPFDIPRKIK